MTATATPTKVIKVSVFSDITCPWCFIGAKEMDKAIEKVKIAKGSKGPKIEFEIQHKPFLLNPTLANDDVQKATEYIGERMGPERWKQARKMINDRGKLLGLPPFTEDAYVFSTWRAHRLLQYAWNKTGAEVQRNLLYAIYEGNFIRGENLNDVGLLAKYAESAGLMSKDEAVKFLESDELHSEVQAMVSCAQRNGVSGVPFTIVDGKWAISGGQNSEVFLNIFQKLADGKEP